MTKLNQVIALSKTKKSAAQSAKTTAYHLLQKTDLYAGMNKEYQPKDEDGERLPPDSKMVQAKTMDVIKSIDDSLASMFNIVIDQDIGNTLAKADVVIDGEVILAGLPAVSLIFLEKELTDLKNFISAIPTLSADREWRLDANDGLYKTDEIQTHRTRKTQRAIVLYDATEHHPAQTQLISEDEIAGYWNTRYISGAIPSTQKQSYMQRLCDLKEAVVRAREEANSVEIESQNQGSKIFEYIFRD